MLRRGCEYEGNISGLQTRVTEVYPYALYVHCVAHRLNLVVQDALTEIIRIRDFVGTIKDMIKFVRNSPYRLSIFKDMQSDDEPSPSLAA